jgi:putative membrane protein
MIHKGLILLHLVGFAAYLGAGFAQQRFMARSLREGIAAAVRDEYERLAATITTQIELPALFAQVVTGIAFVVLVPAWLKEGWLHGKLTCVAALLVLSHLEMFNARRVVKARAARGEDASAEIAARKTRHALFGLLGSAAVVVLVVLVAYGTG